jgi:hypothetical protein
MRTSDQINDLALAMVRAQAAMKPAIKDSTNPAFRSKYADLAAVWDACRGPLTTEGIAVWQDVTLSDEGVSVTTRLVHASGQWAEFGPLTVPLTKRDAHGVGSATSYGKRYALSAAVGIVTEDDDGNAAVSASEPKAAPVKVQPRPEGYDDWRDTLQAAAETGTAALKETWTKAQPEYRSYMNATNPKALEALKATAEKVGVSA